MDISKIETDDLALLRHITKHFQKKYSFSIEYIKSLLSNTKEINLIPLSIFSTKLGPLEALVKYLKENLEMSNKKISTILNKSLNTISTTYKHSQKKQPKKFSKVGGKKISLSIFSNSKLSILENLISYLKEYHGITNRQIAVLLNRDSRTIWTTYDRAKKKNER